MRISVVAKTVVLNDNQEVLIMRRSASDDNRPGEWDFPGGGVEDNEDILAAAVRELDEEAGIKVGANTLKLVYAGTELKELDNSVTRLLFIARVSTPGVVLSDEHDLHEWVDLNTALEKFPHKFYATGLSYALEHGLIDE